MSTEHSPDIEAALSVAHNNGDQAGLLRILAVGKLVLPQLQPLDQEGGLRLPLVEQQGTRYVIAFSSQQRLAESEVDAAQTITATGRQLAELWPDNDDLWLIINPHSEHSAAIPAEAIRTLLSTTGHDTGSGKT